MIKNEEKMRVRIAKERSDLSDLAAAAIKATYNTRNPGEVERCIDVLNQLKSLSLTVKDFQLSESIVKLDPLRRHKNPKIRKEAQALFHSWLKTIYTQGKDNSFKASLTQFHLKPKKKHVLTRCSGLKKKEERRRSTAREDNDFYKADLEKETKTNLKPLNLKRRRVTLEYDAEATWRSYRFTDKEDKVGGCFTVSSSYNQNLETSSEESCCLQKHSTEIRATAD